MTIQLAFSRLPACLPLHRAALSGPVAPTRHPGTRVDRRVHGAGDGRGGPHVDRLARGRIDPHVDRRWQRGVDAHVDGAWSPASRRTLDGILGAALMVAVALVGAAMAGSEALHLALP